LIAVVQRAKEASVWVSDKEVSKIGKGILLLVGISKGDSEKDVNYITNKVVNLRIFSDENGNLNLSLIEIKGEILVVSQFTLLGDTKKGRRPSFSNAMQPEKAKAFYNELINQFKEYKIPVKEGVFGAMMGVKLINDGPVTLIVNSRDKKLN